MFTPLQHQANFSPFATYRDFNITLNDACENYFFGHRPAVEGGYKAPWWLTVPRIISFFTLIIPAIVAITFIVTSLLIRSDAEEKEMWEESKKGEKERFQVTTQMPWEYKPELIWKLSRSGIKKMYLDTVIFNRCGLGGARILNDGSFETVPHNVDRQILVVNFNWAGDLKTSLKQSNEAEPLPANFARICSGTIDGLFPWRISNRVKEAIILTSNAHKSPAALEPQKAPPTNVWQGVKVAAVALTLITLLGLLIGGGALGGISLLGTQAGAPFFMHTLSLYIPPLLSYGLLGPGALGALGALSLTTYGSVKLAQTCSPPKIITEEPSEDPKGKEKETAKQE